MRGRLNLFQSTMLRWRELHPYNAVHVLSVERPLDRMALRQAAERTLEVWGLTGLVLKGHRFEYRGGPVQVDPRVLPSVGDAFAVLEQEVERQLNCPFPREGAFDPFRVFAIDQGTSFRLGLAYDHFIGAGDSIVFLLQDVWQRYSGGTPRNFAPERYPPRCVPMLVRHSGAVLRGLRRLPALTASCRQSVRPHYTNASDGTNGFSYFRLDAAQTEAVMRTARNCGVTINDLILALTLAAVAPLVGARDPTRRRHEIGVASIMNIRHEFGPAARDAFGQFLGSFRVAHPLPPGTSVVELARDLHAQTAQIKREKLYLQNLLAMEASGLYWRFLTPRQRAGLHAKTYPTWAGVSSLDVNALWRRAGAGEPPEYIRAVPTGPLSPLVLAVTSARNLLHVGVSFRTAAVSRMNIATMSDLFVDLTRQLAA